MSAYDLIAFDMDGTLLNGEKRLTPGVLRAVNAAAEAGKTVVYATGRALTEMEEYFLQAPRIRYGLLCSGGVLYDVAARRVLDTAPFPAETVLRVLELAAPEDILLQPAYADRVFLQKGMMDRLEDYGMGIYEPMYRRAMTETEDIRGYIAAHPEGILKLNLYHRDPEARLRTLGRMAELPVERVFSEKTSLELSPAGAGKGSGLLRLCRLLGIAPERTVAVGDNDNDLQLLSVAGLPLAMGNANARVKAACRAVLPSCDEDGCAEAIYRYLLGKR